VGVSTGLAVGEGADVGVALAGASVRTGVSTTLLTAIDGARVNSARGAAPAPTRLRSAATWVADGGCITNSTAVAATATSARTAGPTARTEKMDSLIKRDDTPPASVACDSVASLHSTCQDETPD
jgi:hypothetical protein